MLAAADALLAMLQDCSSSTVVAHVHLCSKQQQVAGKLQELAVGQHSG
jgi:hypothetical protein